MSEKICVLGGGSWGATIASHLADAGHAVSLWEFVDAQVQHMKKTRSLPFLPQLHIPESIQITSQMNEALANKDILFSIVPSQFVRATWKNAAAHVSKVRLVCSLSKGIEVESLMRMSEVIAQECPKAKGKIVVIAGPSHAEEVAQKVPTAVVASAPDRELAELAQKILTTPVFRVYTQPDAIGTEVCGSLKNVFAIACGACDGLGLGDNTKAALITRGLNEMARIGEKLGANHETFFGLAGMGDLVVTCFSRHSRNRMLGEKIGQGLPVEKALKEMPMVAEGYPTAKSAYQLAQKTNVDSPIIVEIYRMLYENKNIRDSMRDLLTRPAHEESEHIQWKSPS